MSTRPEQNKPYLEYAPQWGICKLKGMRSYDPMASSVTFSSMLIQKYDSQKKRSQPKTASDYCYKSNGNIAGQAINCCTGHRALLGQQTRNKHSTEKDVWVINACRAKSSHRVTCLKGEYEDCAMASDPARDHIKFSLPSQYKSFPENSFKCRILYTSYLDT